MTATLSFQVHSVMLRIFQLISLIFFPLPAHHHIEIKPKICHQIIPHLATEEMKMEQFFFSVQVHRIKDLAAAASAGDFSSFDLDHLPADAFFSEIRVQIHWHRSTLYPPSRAQNLPTEKDFIM